MKIKTIWKGFCLNKLKALLLFFGMLHVGYGVRGRGRMHASKGCEFPERWTGTWFQKGVHPPIKIQKDIFSFKGKCLAADSHMFYIEDTTKKVIFSKTLQSSFVPLIQMGIRAVSTASVLPSIVKE
ncbi:hypothetical protein NPIL_159601 [Nephila pilipes]|uniref:DUF7044 domain-containing protein n=1 Tax=Nephila pilipes TaxID=299642 RepID=A0A8X6QXD7_NEPPI|nr:hypothetical protein NPIL_159601 [Nephila pilipes]